MVVIRRLWSYIPMMLATLAVLKSCALTSRSRMLTLFERMPACTENRKMILRRWKTLFVLAAEASLRMANMAAMIYPLLQPRLIQLFMRFVEPEAKKMMKSMFVKPASQKISGWNMEDQPSTAWPKPRTQCEKEGHKEAIRQYPARGGLYRICDQCGARWHKIETEWVEIEPRPAPDKYNKTGANKMGRRTPGRSGAASSQAASSASRSRCSAPSPAWSPRQDLPAIPRCNRCKEEFGLKFNREDNSPFWACPNFPQCRQTKGIPYEEGDQTKLAQVLVMLQVKLSKATSPIAPGVPELSTSIRKLAQLMETMGRAETEAYDIGSQVSEDDGMMSELESSVELSA